MKRIMENIWVQIYDKEGEVERRRTVARKILEQTGTQLHSMKTPPFRSSKRLRFVSSMQVWDKPPFHYSDTIAF